MNVSTIEVDPEVAGQKYREYREIVKTRKAKEYNELRRTYRALEKGYKVIDIFKAFADTGVSAAGLPKLAIARADATKIIFVKQREGAGLFTRHEQRWGKHETASEVELPVGTFPDWKTQTDAQGNPMPWSILDERMITNVPIIPAHLMPADKLENYYILFDVKKWDRFASTKDPYLLQRINANTFIVMAEWDVTDVEAIVMRGRA
jgi:hypothetical protein